MWNVVRSSGGGFSETDRLGKVMIIITVLPWNSSRSVIKSMARCDHGQGVMGMSLPARRMRGTLDFTQMVQKDTNFWMCNQGNIKGPDVPVGERFAHQISGYSIGAMYSG